MDYNKIMELYKNRYAEAGDFTFLLVGNIDLATATPLIEQYLGGLPTISRKENFRDPKMDIRKGDYENNFIRDMETAKSSIMMVYSGNCQYTLKNKIMMSMFDQLLDILYTRTVREEAGGTYGVSSWASISKYPQEEGTLNIYFDTDPNRREQMVGLIKQGLQDFIANGPATEDLNKVKEYMLKTYQQNQKENGYWMGALNEFYWTGLDMNKDYEATVNGVTIDDLKAFAKAFIGQNNVIEVSMSTPATK